MVFGIGAVVATSGVLAIGLHPESVSAGFPIVGKEWVCVGTSEQVIGDAAVKTANISHQEPLVPRGTTRFLTED
jgi:hypothetical protein